MAIDFSVCMGLFAAAMIAATLLPAQSELVLVSLLLAGEQPMWALILAAWAGNTGGSVINWLLGRYFSHLRDRKWFPVKAESLRNAERWYKKYGRWSLILSWVPVIGDPLTLIAGMLRESFIFFVCVVSLAKMARYLIVAGLTLHWFA